MLDFLHLYIFSHALPLFKNKTCSRKLKKFTWYRVLPLNKNHIFDQLLTTLIKVAAWFFCSEQIIRIVKVTWILYLLFSCYRFHILYDFFSFCWPTMLQTTDTLGPFGILSKNFFVKNSLSLTQVKQLVIFFDNFSRSKNIKKLEKFNKCLT